MTHPERSPKTPRNRTGFSAFPFIRGGSASSRHRRSAFVAILTIASLSLAFAATPVLAAFIHTATPTSFGSPGTGAGQLRLAPPAPAAGSNLAVDQETGDLYVADTGNHRVDEFSSNGSFIRAFGADVGGPGINVCMSSCTAGTASDVPGALRNPTLISVDNSGGPSQGDVYVASTVVNSGDPTIVSKFNDSGNLISGWATSGQLTGLGDGEDVLPGIAVDSHGDLFIAEIARPEVIREVIREFDEEGHAIGPAGLSVERSFSRQGSGIVVDADGDIFFHSFIGELWEFSASSKLAEQISPKKANAIALDPASNDLYDLEEQGVVDHYAAACSAICTPLEEFGSGSIAEGSGIAINATTGSVYVASAESSDILVFAAEDAKPAPTVTANPFAESSYTTARVTGTVNPNSRPTVCRFEYVSEETFQPGDQQQQITVAATGGTFQLGFEGQNTGPLPFDAPASQVEASLEALSTIGGVGGSVSVAGGPGDETGEHPYRITFGGTLANRSLNSLNFIAGSLANGGESATTTVRQGSPGGFSRPKSQPCAANPGSGASAVPVEADLSGLAPSTTYHVRLAAQSAAGLVRSEDPAPTLETKAVVAPTVSIEPVTVFTATTAHFSGHINPNAPEPLNPEIEAAFKVAWHFHCTPACPGIEGELAADGSSHEVSAIAEGLLPGRKYKVTLVAENAGLTVSAGPTPFTTLVAPPRVDGTFVSAVNTSQATLNAQINPGGGATTYHFEYITEEQFEKLGFSEPFSTPTESLGTGNEDLEAKATVEGLAAETAYVFRVVATNSVAPGGVDGPVKPFITYSTAPASTGCANEALREENESLALPDCRAYEQVSPTDNAAVFQQAAFRGSSPGAIFETNFPMQASADGDAVAYVGEAPSSGLGEGTGNLGAGEGDQHLATRTKVGWTSADISPLGSSQNTYYEAFSGDLSRGIISTFHQSPLGPGVETPCELLYSRDNSSGAFTPLFLTESATCHRPFFVGASADGSHQLFESASAKTERAKKAIGAGHENIYDSVGGQLYPVNIFPTGKADPNATVGRLSAPQQLLSGVGTHLPAVDTEGVVSADGSRIFWTDLNTGILYVRENDTQPEEECTAPPQPLSKSCTVQVSAATATYQTATPDGHYAYYTEAGQLWRFDVVTETRQALSGVGADVQGVIGVNRTGEDGSYLYFVAEGALAPGAEARICSQNGNEEEAREESEGKAPVGRGCNLYLLHAGETTFIAALLPGDDQFGQIANSASFVGDWQAILGHRTAQLSSDGSNLVFMSRRRLTTYDNVGSGLGQCDGGAACPEIYIYDAASHQISCVSCDPAGVPPTGPQDTLGTFLPPDYFSITHTHRFIAGDGNRVFFNSDQSLVPGDGNHGEQDVYEWEHEGTGSCAHGSPFNSGCIYLLSSGKPGDFSAIVDVSESGDDAFFVTRARLAPADRDDKPDLYGARVEGGFPVPAEAIPCPGAESCHGPGTPAPQPRPVGSETFHGPEEGSNHPHPAPCKKGYVKKRGTCVKRHHKPRKHHKRAIHHNRGGAK